MLSYSIVVIIVITNNLFKDLKAGFVENDPIIVKYIIFNRFLLYSYIVVRLK